MQIHELPAQTTANDADVFAIDDGNATQKITVANLGKKVAEDATPAFTSGDAASPTEWSDVSVVASGTALKTILNRITTMMKNVRWLYSKLGTTDISGVGGGTVTDAISFLNAISVGVVTASDKTAITPAVGQNYSVYENSFFLRKGNICWMHLGLRSVPTSGRQVIVSSVPDRFKPLIVNKFVGTGGTGYNVYVWGEITTSAVAVHTSDGYVQVDGIYLCANADS